MANSSARIQCLGMVGACLVPANMWRHRATNPEEALAQHICQCPASYSGLPWETETGLKPFMELTIAIQTRAISDSHNPLMSWNHKSWALDDRAYCGKTFAWLWPSLHIQLNATPLSLTQLSHINFFRHHTPTLSQKHKQTETPSLNYWSYIS